MPEQPGFQQAREQVLALSYPPVTLSVPPARALGYRLARGVMSKAGLPPRPFALVDGLAVSAASLRAPGGERSVPEQVDLAVGTARSAPEPEQAHAGNGQTAEEIVLHEREPATAEPPVGGNGEPHEHAVELNELTTEIEALSSAADEFFDRLAQPEAEAEQDYDSQPPVRLQLRPGGGTGRRDESLGPGQAVAVIAGGEVPRGTDFVIPFVALFGEPEAAAPDLPPAPEMPEPQQRGQSRSRDERERRAERRAQRNQPAPVEVAEEAPAEVEEEDLPSAEPPRVWDLASRFGEVSDVPRSIAEAARRAGNLVPIGAWSRAREEVLPEKTLLRAGDVSLLEALGFDEVEVYRRPVIGIASLGLSLPQPGRRPDEVEEVPRGRKSVELPCPLAATALNLCRAAQVAALPLGFAPRRFRALKVAVERWVTQVDILVLVGGPSHGPRCLAQDVIAASGRLELAGTGVAPIEGLSAGVVRRQPVFAIPGSLPATLAGVVLLVRPLLHKYTPLLHFAGELQLELEQGSALHFPVDTAVPVRYGWNEQRNALSTRFDGTRRANPWSDYVQGQALVVLEGGRQYSDGDFVTAYPY